MLMWRREKRRESKNGLQAYSPAQTQKPRKSVTRTSGPCINSDELTIIWVGCKKAVKKSYNQQLAVL